ncbi:hypothetical protein N7457_001341 [Penicillium paradoxum]|uniref:uncharacterized protein n=1 Tax=Penicillium paradoxum TaxID=176176 RepID=UPI0025474B08|nr:uncharacterized protein N7457_001341 [Penicillium paradoxum]KAJ5794742.1 hypothetical protein N7457_001341 [Penicillium paradoxum]
MADQEFEQFKPEIERLYVDGDNTLSEVMSYMTDKYGLSASKTQYVRKLKKWGFTKGTIPAEDWKWIGKRMNKRKWRDNKESEIHIGGKEVQASRVKKAKYGPAYSSTIAHLSTAPSPKTPEGIVVCTPASTGMSLTWNTSLPWLRFTKLFRPPQNQDMLTIPEVQSPSSSLTVYIPPASALSRTVNLEVMRRLSTLIPWERLTHPANIHSSSRTSAALSILMPEEFAGQHEILSTGLSSSKHKGTDLLALELFLLSNNFASQDANKISESILRQDAKRVIDMFNYSGWNNLKHIKLMLSTREPTAEAIAERVFASALRLYNMDMIKLMLEANMDPNNALVQSVTNVALTPLQFAARESNDHSEDLVKLLISHGADVNHSCNERPPLYYAINAGVHNEIVIRTLLSHGATATPFCLSAATSLTDVVLFEDIASSCPDVNARTGWQDQSTLAEAVTRGNVAIIEVLIAKGAQINELVVIEFENDMAMTTILGLGVESDFPSVIYALLGGCDDVNPIFDGLTYVSPLTLAMQNATAEMIRALLQAGVDPKVADRQGKMTLLERAATRENALEICSVLIGFGAQVDRPFSITGHQSSALLIAVKQRSTDVVGLLIHAGARLNDEYTESPSTLLGAAVEHGDRMLINGLLAAGATHLGTKLRKIGNLDTAQHLQANGLLRAVLETSGSKILAAALSTKDNNLTQYLLDHGADMEDNGELPPDQTPLACAIREKHTFFAEALLDRGAEVTDSVLQTAILEDYGNLRLLLSIFTGNAPNAVSAAICEDGALGLLQDAGVDPSGVPGVINGEHLELDFELPPPESVLEVAVSYQDTEALQTLLQWTSWSPRLIGRALTLAIILHEGELAEHLLHFGPDMAQEITIKYYDYEDELGEVEGEKETYSALQAAAKYQNIPIARKLVGKVDVDFLGDGPRRRTAMQHAVEKANVELIDLLLEHNAKVDGPPATNGGVTALQIASIKGYISIARRLLDLGADVNEAPAKWNGRMALQGAAEHGRIDMLQLLLEEGALVVGEGEPQYHKAVELAVQNGFNAAARLLRSWKESVYLDPATI